LELVHPANSQRLEPILALERERLITHRRVRLGQQVLGGRQILPDPSMIKVGRSQQSIHRRSCASRRR